MRNNRGVLQFPGKKIVLAACLTLAAAPLAADWQMERFESRHPAGGIDALKITNLHGDIRVRTTGEDLIEVTAIMQRDDGVAAPRILVDYDARPPTIEVSLAAPESADTLQRADLAVSLPAHVELVAETRAGLLEVKGRAAAVDARSTTGRIYVSTRAAVDVQNAHGAVEIVFDGTPAGTIETLTGDVTTWLPQASATRVRVRTQSHITTDFTVRIDIDEDGFRNGVARLGRGRSLLDVRSTRGAVRLLRPGR